MTIAVDFDGTIVEHAYPEIGKPIPFALDVLKKLQQEEHHQIILWSVREGELLDRAVKYCEKNGVKFYAVNQNYPDEKLEEGISRKINADIYIDDKNIGGLPDWGIIYQIIKSGSNNLADLDSFMENNRPNRKKNFFIRLGESWDMVKRSRY
jgi:hypothetical protein